ncbi:hypothetical protein [Lacticaseibacillus paracasei]|uniref:hypothetical protein n=1 Tax=Lacticaseibacillus paracasei TaxID=1597 RepID=UPI00272F9486|nr:hypothetical protein [Lacticaseibacillus paracasei]MDP0529109.1 hypothetical protein [Lacticaseibacillus paracasei]
MLFDNIKGPAKQMPTPPMRPPAPTPKMEGHLPTRATATKKYKDKLIGEINAAIEKNIGTANPIDVGVTNYNVAVVNEVIESLKDSGWDVGSIYGGGQDRVAIITLS